MNFWAAKLSGEEPPPQTQQPVAWWSTGVPPEANPYTPEAAIAHSAQKPLRTTAPSADKGGTCPNCGRGSYMQPSRSVQARCFECNYPNLQALSGVSPSHGTPFGKPVPQAPAFGFHPEFIAERL